MLKDLMNSAVEVLSNLNGSMKGSVTFIIVLWMLFDFYLVWKLG